MMIMSLMMINDDNEVDNDNAIPIIAKHDNINNSLIIQNTIHLQGMAAALKNRTRCHPGEVRGKKACLKREPETNPLTRYPET